MPIYDSESAKWYAKRTAEVYRDGDTGTSMNISTATLTTKIQNMIRQARALGKTPEEQRKNVLDLK